MLKINILLNKFKTRVEKCFTKTAVERTKNLQTYQYSVDGEACLFEENLKKAALEPVYSLALIPP